MALRWVLIYWAVIRSRFVRIATERTQRDFATTAPRASAPTDLSGFQRARAGQAENGMRSGGYTLARTEA